MPTKSPACSPAPNPGARPDSRCADIAVVIGGSGATGTCRVRISVSQDCGVGQGYSNRSGWPVAARTALHAGPFGSRRFWRLARSLIGTWMNRSCR